MKKTLFEETIEKGFATVLPNQSYCAYSELYYMATSFPPTLDPTHDTRIAPLSGEIDAAARL